MVEYLKLAKNSFGVVTLDASWGPATYNILKKAKLTNTLIINERKPAEKRTFSFTNDDVQWTEQILNDLAHDLNVVVATLSAERAYSLSKAASEVVDPSMILVITSKTDDALRKKLRDVEALFSGYQLVIFSPTIAAGVDFSIPFFDRMYFYACSGSALPSTALQMLFRVRKLADTTVRCLMAPNMRTDMRAPTTVMTPADTLDWLMWMSTELMDRDGPQRVVEIEDEVR
jgi:hypothetical protein